MSISLKKHNTGTYRQTTEKITNLSTKRVTLEEKIQIFERFSKTGEELLGNTKFEGHPIGQWAIQIRSILKRGDREKRLNNLTEEQLKRLENIGILERRIDSTIDEKIDALIAWRKKYPEASLKELSEIITIETGNPITKSGLNHRFRKIKELATRFKNLDKK